MHNPTPNIQRQEKVIRRWLLYGSLNSEYLPASEFSPWRLLQGPSVGPPLLAADRLLIWDYRDNPPHDML